VLHGQPRPPLALDVGLVRGHARLAGLLPVPEVRPVRLLAAARQAQPPLLVELPRPAGLERAPVRGCRAAPHPPQVRVVEGVLGARDPEGALRAEGDGDGAVGAAEAEEDLGVGGAAGEVRGGGGEGGEA